VPLIKRAVDDVDASHDTVALGDAAAAPPVKADGVHFVKIGQRVVFLGEVGDRLDGRDMPVHGIDALEDDDLRRAARVLLELFFQMLHVVVADDVLLTAAMANALDHRSVVLLVGEDHETRDQALQGGERRLVGDIGRGEAERSLLAVQIGKLGLELDMIVGSAGDVAGAAGAGADGLDRLMHGFAHRRMLAHAEIVVGAPHRHVVAANLSEVIGGGIGSAAALQIGEDPVAALLMQGLKMQAKTILVIHAEDHG
jgi:hypothetical protein